MKKIILLCGGGMSSSLLVTKMRNAAQEQNYDCEIQAYGIGKLEYAIKEADVILIGPQVGYNIKSFQAKAQQPLEVIDRRDYGMVDGEKVLAHARRLMGEI